MIPTPVLSEGQAVLDPGRLYDVQSISYATPERTWTYQTPFEQGDRSRIFEWLQQPEPRGTEVSFLASFDGLNYIRNSVKVVVDMYDGSGAFFIMDPKDPILAAYRQRSRCVQRPRRSLRRSQEALALSGKSVLDQAISTEPST